MPNGGNAQSGAFTGPEAQQMMTKHIEQMIQQTQDPTLKQQLQMMLDQLRSNAPEPK